ncbi:hypothetical protein [Intestinibacter sp.]|uniref:hypothetical protein n=1 Tax=Intestinibacter sp. TaxID=1965304 RepID=UPI002A76538D|nr:hypothetical protein [Intestinibacter sp.]MDY2736811.1 hypothetical protein [Intestinibacter sp.]
MYYEIETAFDIGDKVYYIGSDNNIKELTINNISIRKTSITSNFEIFYKMGVYEVEEPDMFGKYFHTKKELVKHIVSQL